MIEAERIKARTLAIPPIGAGRLGYPASVVAKVLTEEVANYIASHPESYIIDVRFVVLASDDDILQAFTRALKTEDIESAESAIDDEIRHVTLMRRKQVKEAQTKIGQLQSEQYKRCEIKQDDPEFQAVLDNMMKSRGERYIPCVYKIERVENRWLYQMYQMSKLNVEQTNKPAVDNERQLWHGTTAEAAENICLYGFNRAYCGRNAIRYGKGVYFARDFSYSADDTYSPPDKDGLKYVIQSRVLSGQFIEGDDSMVEAPERDAGMRYDSTVDNTANPLVFVIFLDYKMYPEYIMSFFG